MPFPQHPQAPAPLLWALHTTGCRLSPLSAVPTRLGPASSLALPPPTPRGTGPGSFLTPTPWRGCSLPVSALVTVDAIYSQINAFLSRAENKQLQRRSCTNPAGSLPGRQACTTDSPGQPPRAGKRAWINAALLGCGAGLSVFPGRQRKQRHRGWQRPRGQDGRAHRAGEIQLSICLPTHVCHLS